MRRIVWGLLIVSWATLAHAQDGAGLYAQHCGQCHDGGLPRVPARRVLSGMEPERILAAVETGTMRTQGAARTAAEKRAIAAFLSGKAVGDSPAPPPPKMCATSPAATDTTWNGWGVSPTNARFQPETAAKLAAADVTRLKLKWAFGFAGDTAAAVQPSIAKTAAFSGTSTPPTNSRSSAV